jgi:hypothetical protein
MANFWSVFFSQFFQKNEGWGGGMANFGVALSLVDH